MNGLYIANILNGVICLCVIIAFAWKDAKRAPKTLEDLTSIPDSFGAPTSDRLDITVRSITDVETVSEQVIRFCSDHGVDERRSYLSGLALEEMSGNAVLHGFTKDRKKHHSVDIRVMLKGDDILLRQRDDCVPFNPEDRARLLDPEDKIRNIGIRLVFGTAKDIHYQNLLGLNVLTIHI